MTAILEVYSLEKNYRTKGKSVFKAVDGISFSIERGECFGLLGPNGAGKSTTMKCITAFYPLSAGRVLINGVDVHKYPRQARQILGVCNQEETLDTDFSVFNQMARYASFFRIPKKQALEKTEELLKRFGLFDKRNDMVETLSGGMKRRLQVARSLVSDPLLLILDEPTTGLDPESRRALWDVIKDYRAKGLAILLSTHYMEEAQRLCDRVSIIHQGRLLDTLAPDELIKKHISEEFIREELRPGVKWERPPNLEDVYLKLTGTKLKEWEDAVGD